VSATVIVTSSCPGTRIVVSAINKLSHGIG
jgi:hypothetical protein